ncbi:hypothetical protein Ate02nite_46510 [Paractinoplanes tereljensis]|uniref:Uncharacterized protein n=1 Tax=Paractinoplanes tereljensis TaxID=571912 RepID=A0A919TTP6_9ACTN|nr:hypothetical protein Ate02nite_46510 [Actinoplanes tereljensis]
MAARLCWGRNPLRRREDRLEGWLNAVLLLAFLLIGSTLAAHLSRSTYREQTRVVAWERQHRFEVWAMLLETPTPAAKARWKAPDGTPRVGRVIADPATSVAGTWVTVWVDENGAPASPPLRRSPVTSAAGVAIAAIILVAVGILLVWLPCRLLLNRFRLRAWQAEWLRVGPRWSRYR